MTTLPPQYNHAAYEKKWWAFWTEQRLFAADSESAREPYAILMPPPNVTDRLHMGHGLNNTLQDIYIRWQRMLGKEVCWLPGTDHAGIATQMMVEKSLQKEGTTRQELGREEFVKRCWQWKEEHGDIIVSQLQRLGASADWERQAFTMSPQLSQAVRCIFVDLYRKGLIYRGERLVNWDFALNTAISDDEVVNIEETGKLWSFAYPLADGSGELVVATTRPETMFGDTAVAVHPDDARYQAFIGKQVILPLTERTLPVIADTYVKQDFGSGCVKITPGHDFNDFAIGKRHHLPLLNIFDARGLLNEHAPPKLRGLARAQARPRTVQLMQDAGLLRGEVKHRLTRPYSDRSKVLIEPRLSRQWFLKMQPLVGEAVRIAQDDELRFYPHSWKKTYLHWLENIEDWCISRQLWWGHRIPVWHCADCEKHTVTKNDPERCEHCHSAALTQDEDVLDTWFSSWLWPFSTLGWPMTRDNRALQKFYPSQVLITGADIIFLWVARMVVAGLETVGTPPFKEVYFNAIICDHQGRKFSKTLGNGIDPLAVIEAHGADAVRYTCVSLAPLGGRARLGLKDFEHGSRFINKLWNAARFLLAQSTGPAELPALAHAQLSVPELWLLSEFNQTVEKITKHLHAYRVDNLAASLYHFIWGTYCDWGVEIAKNILHQQRLSPAQILATMTYVMDGLLRLAHPVMPFISEEIWQRLPAQPDWDRPRSLAVAKFPDAASLRPIAAEKLRHWEFTRRVITAVRTLRSKGTIPPRQKINVSIVVGAAAQDLHAEEEWLCDLALLDKIDWLAADAPKPVPARVQVGAGFEVYTSASHLDVPRERAVLSKEQARLETLLQKIASKLSNPAFCNKAPPQILQEQQEKQRALQEQLHSVRLNLQALGEG